MSQTVRDFLAGLAARIDAIAEGRADAASPPPPGLDADLARLAAAVDLLSDRIATLRRMSVALANGQIDFDVPPRQHLLDPLKSLQSSLRHLTWQTQEVAAGNLNQKVAFLGDFSTAFNRMVEALRAKEKAEREAMQASRLAAIGQLAAGIAHEINTPAQYVGDNLRFLDQAVTQLADAARAAQGLAAAVEAGPAAADAGLAAALQAYRGTAPVDLADTLAELPGAIADSLAGVEQIARIVQSVKEFAHPGSAEKVPIDINHVLDNVLAVSHNAWKMVAEVVRDFAPDLPMVSCRQGEINQVFLNLILNAAQAIDGGGGAPGRIVVTTRQDGDGVEVRVSDNGPGVPEAIREQIFDPFFTTKPVGQGTGQGLAICHDLVVNKHRGRLSLAPTEPGRGAAFIVHLPIAGDG